MAGEVEEVTSDAVAAWIEEADSGSEEHQTKLGAHFLSLADAGVDRDENAKKAIQWLLLASRQGSKEATTLLIQCTKTGTGITSENMENVKWCINTSTSEKKIRHAARKLFHSINKTRKETLSQKEYLEALGELTDKDQKLLAAAGKKIGEEISENSFVKFLSKKIHGKLTLTSDEMDEVSAAYQSASIATKIFVYPRQTASVVLNQGLELASTKGLNVIMSMVPTNQIYILAMLFAYSFLTPAFIFLIVPLFVFYLSSLALLICTLQMFYKKKKQKDAMDLASVLQKFDVNIDIDDTQSQYSWNSLTPYFVFFGTLPIVVVSFSLANKSYIPCSECFIISAIMTGFCFVGLSDEHDRITLFLLLANAIASLPVFLSNFPQINPVAWLVKVLTNPFIFVDLGLGIRLNLSIPSLFYLAIPFFFLHIGVQKSWNGLHRVVVPHLVCYFWWNVMTTMYPFTTSAGLARATIGYLLFPLLVPFSLLLFLGGGVYLLYKLCQAQLFGKIIVTLFLLSIPVLLMQTKTLVGKKEDKKMNTLKKAATVVFALLALVPLLYIKIPELAGIKTPVLLFDDYESMCLPRHGENVPAYQIRCASFFGMKVSWDGKFVWSKVIRIENTAESVLNALPFFLSKPLYCIYGDKRDCKNGSLLDVDYQHCKLMESLGYGCDLRSHNVYTFQIGVNVKGVKVVLDAGNGFYSKVMVLNVSDEVEFTGTLLDGLGTESPRLKLSSLKVLNRELPEIMQIEKEEDENLYYNVINSAVRVTLNFFFFPVFEYTI